MLLQFKRTVFYCNILSKVIYFCDAKLDFQHSVSHDPSEIILICCFAAQTCIIIILKSYYLQHIVVETVIQSDFFFIKAYLFNLANFCLYNITIFTQYGSL